MTEHDTPSTARTEAERRWPTVTPRVIGADYSENTMRSQSRMAFEAGAEWALAQVREGLEALQLEDDDDAPVSEAEAAFDAAYEDVRRLALAVVDRLEGKP